MPDAFTEVKSTPAQDPAYRLPVTRAGEAQDGADLDRVYRGYHLPH